MKNIASNIMITGLLTILLFSSGIAQMHEWKQSKRGMHDKQFQILSKAEELGLNDGQLSDLKNIQHDYLKKSINMDASIKILELDFRKSMIDDASEKDLNKQVDKITTKMGEKRKLHISKHFKVKNTLTDEQWKKWKKSRHGNMRKMKKQMQKGKMQMNRRKM